MFSRQIMKRHKTEGVVDVCLRQFARLGAELANILSNKDELVTCGVIHQLISKEE